jgi:hypothetical protein
MTVKRWKRWQAMYRSGLVVSALIVTLLIPVVPAVARGGALSSLRPHAVSVSAHGLTLTLETPRAAYPPDALVPVTVSLRNHTNPDARDELCAGFLPSVQMHDPAGDLVSQPPIPAAMTHPACFDPTVPVALPVGGTLHWSGLVIVHAPRLRATQVIYGKNTGQGLFGGPSFVLQTPVLKIRALPLVRTRATIQASPALHATVQVPPGGRVYYTDRTDCTAPYGGPMTGGTTGWTATHGPTIEPSRVDGCTGISRWRLAVAVEGEAPVWLDRRIAPPPLPAGGTISAAPCRSNSPRGVAAVTAIWHGSIYVIAAHGSHTCRLTAAIGAGEARLSPNGRRVLWSAPEPHRHWISDLWVGSSDGRTPPRRVPGASFNTPYPVVIWSPGGKTFAYGRGGSIFVVRPEGGTPQVLSSHGQYGSLPLAWMPNGSAVVSQKDSVGGQWTHQFDLAINGLSGGQSTALVRFPSWISNPHARPIGSYPLSQLAIGADGRHVVLATSGGGVRLSGVWEAGLVPGIQGEVARLIVGTRARVRGYSAPAEHLNGATHMFASPDGRYVVVDPTAGFWVVDTRTHQGRLLRVPSQPDCVISQSVWTAREPGIAFVFTCRLGAGAAFRSTLWSVDLRGGAPRRLLSAIDRQPDGISINMVYRCVRCGFNPGT